MIPPKKYVVGLKRKGPCGSLWDVCGRRKQVAVSIVCVYARYRERKREAGRWIGDYREHAPRFPKVAGERRAWFVLCVSCSFETILRVNQEAFGIGLKRRVTLPAGIF